MRGDNFYIKELESMIQASRQIIQHSHRLKEEAIAKEHYVNAEGYRVSIVTHQDLIHKMTRIVAGQPAFEPLGKAEAI